MRSHHAVALLSLLIMACGDRSRASSSSWLVLYEDSRARVALDTTRLSKVGDSLSVHLRYDTKDREYFSTSGSAPYAIESVEIPDCASESARVRSAVYLDSAGREIRRISTAMIDSAPPHLMVGQRMVGRGGPALCRFLRSKGFLQ